MPPVRGLLALAAFVLAAGCAEKSAHGPAPAPAAPVTPSEAQAPLSKEQNDLHLEKPEPRQQFEPQKGQPARAADTDGPPAQKPLSISVELIRVGIRGKGVKITWETHSDVDLNSIEISREVVLGQSHTASQMAFALSEKHKARKVLLDLNIASGTHYLYCLRAKSQGKGEIHIDRDITIPAALKKPSIEQQQFQTQTFTHERSETLAVVLSWKSDDLVDPSPELARKANTPGWYRVRKWHGKTEEDLTEKIKNAQDPWGFVDTEVAPGEKYTYGITHIWPSGYETSGWQETVVIGEIVP